MKYILIFLLLLLPTLCFGAVTFDITSTANGVGVTSLTWSHTVTGANPVIICTYHGTGAAISLFPVSYNGGSLAGVDAILSGAYGVAAFQATGVATGAHNAVIDLSAFGLFDFVGSCGSFAGVDQVTPIGTTVTNTSDPLDSGSVTMPANGYLYEVAIWAHGTTACTTSNATAGGQTKQFQDCANNGDGASYSGFGSTRSTTGNFTYDTSDGASAASLAMPINADGGAVTTTATRRRNQ